VIVLLALVRFSFVLMKYVTLTSIINQILYSRSQVLILTEIENSYTMPTMYVVSVLELTH
jgi:hypothetical protein